ncbi:MAG TPA: hypothetical protein VIA18_17890 [Polyangia bacterium]|nr:hypothetical protein [Polyangia bacterium]
MKRAVVFAIVVGAAGVSAAAPRAIVVEAVVGKPDSAAGGAAGETSDVHAYLPDVIAALGQPLADRALADAVDAHFGPAPAQLSASALAEIAARARQAERNLFFSGTRVRESIDELEAARARLGDAQATLAHDHDARALYQHILLKLSRAYQVTQSPEAAQLAEARMLELVRNVPDLPVDPGRNERELVQLYERLRAAQALTARLVITLPPAALGAHAFVEGQSVDSARSLPMRAGDYRLFAAGEHGDGRLHRVTLTRGEVAVAIDVDFEAALRSDRFVGLAYASHASRAKDETRWVGQLAHGLAATRVYVLAADAADGRPGVAVWGYAVDERGARLVASSSARGAAGSAAPAEVARAAARVAAALDGGPPAPGVTVMAGRKVAAAPSLAAPVAPAVDGDGDGGTRALTIAGWSAVAVGLPLAVTGAALWHHGSNVQSAALVTSGAGLAVAGTVWTLTTTPAQRPRTRAIAIVSALWGAAAVVAAALAAR